MTYTQFCILATQISNLAPRGQDADPQLIADTFTALQLLLSKWSMDGLLEPAFDSVNANFVGGQNTYTMGAAGNFTKRPLNITQAILSGSTLNDVRYPIQVSPWDEFEALTFPSAQGLPSDCYFNPTYPLATLAVYPTPNQPWNILLIGTFAWSSVLPSDTVSLPPGYDDALCDALAVKIAENYNRQVPAWLYNRERDGMSGIRQNIPPKDRAKDNLFATRYGRDQIRNWQTDAPR